MDRRFREVYREQLEVYRATQVAQLFPRPGWSTRALAVVTDAMERGLQEAGGVRPLRPDARLFLTVNLHQMVTMPLSHPASPTELSADVEAGLRSDIREIVRVSNEMTPRERPEMAASHVLRGTAQILENLRLKSWRLWERDE